MSDRLYLCHHCLDVGIIVRDRYRSDGRPLGTFGSPCGHCGGGDAMRRDWTENGLREAAYENERVIERLEALVKSDDPNVEVARWRSAAKQRMGRKEREETAKGFRPLGDTEPDLPVTP